MAGVPDNNHLRDSQRTVPFRVSMGGIWALCFGTAGGSVPEASFPWANLLSFAALLAARMCVPGSQLTKAPERLPFSQPTICPASAASPAAMS